MINGLFFLASIVAVFIVLHWFIENDRVPEDRQTKGLLAMKLPGKELPKGPRRWTRDNLR